MGVLGLRDLETLQAEIWQELNAAPFTDVPRADSAEQMKTALKTAREKTCNLQKDAIKLDNNIKKWMTIPGDVKCLVEEWRNKARLALTQTFIDI